MAALVLFAAIGQLTECLPAAADSGPAADTSTSIRYLTSRGNVTSYEIASALGWLNEKRLKLDSVGFTTDHDAQFWIEAMVRGGKLKSGQLSPEDVETNRFNDLAHLAQQ